jgi:hypothetical protein
MGMGMYMRMTHLRRGSIAFGCAAALAALALTPSDAHACGGCFHPYEETETTVVTAHRMALSLSPTQTVLWDQVQYAGAPSEFAWVLPVKPGARIEVGSDAWFEALETVTSARVTPPSIQCAFNNDFDDNFYQGGAGDDSGCGCIFPEASYGSGAGRFDSDEGNSSGSGVQAPPPVTVVHEGSVGPYDSVTLHANEPNALPNWLTSNGFAIDASIEPILSAYATEGFDFIALKLSPGADVRQMKPVRVVSPGASPVLPLRMVAAGTGANVDITLFVIGEGRWDAENFPNAVVDKNELSWDFSASSSNYSVIREQLLAKDEGRTWLTTFARLGGLLSPINDPVTGQPTVYATNNGSTSTLAELFVMAGFDNGEVDTFGCFHKLGEVADSGSVVVDPCAPSEGEGAGGSGAGGSGAGGSGAGGSGAGGSGGAGGQGGAGGAAACGPVGNDQIDASELVCGTLDDMAVALTGMHPRDVWLTRLESKLPRAALKDDFAMKPTAQDTVEHWHIAPGIVNPPCELASAAAGRPQKGDRDGGGDDWRARKGALFFGLSFAALAAAVLRRARRPRAYAPAALRARAL